MAIAARPPEEPPKAEQLLQAGMHLMREHFADTENTLGAGFQFISPTQVAARAGTSKGMLYHIWGRTGGKAFDSFVAELAARSLVEVNQPDELRASADAIHAQGLGFGEAVALLGDAELDSIVHDPERRLSFQQTLCLTAYAGCGAIRQSLDANSTIAYDDLAPFYEHTLQLYGRRLRRHHTTGRALTPLDFARAISCITEGFAAEAMHTPGLLAADIAWTIGHRSEPASLFAICLVGLVEHLTEPIPEPIPEPGRSTATS